MGERSGVGEVDISKSELGNNEIVVTFIVLTAKEDYGSLIGEESIPTRCTCSSICSSITKVEASRERDVGL